MSLCTPDSRLITQAQDLLSAVKPLFPGVRAKEGPELLKMDPEDVGAYIIWLLGTKIPRLVRADRYSEASHKLALAQGLLLGTGKMSRRDVHLCTVTAPPGVRRRWTVSHISLTV